MMISVDQALEFVLAEQRDFGVEEVDLLQSVGRVLASDVFSDRDFPPFDRVTMDGIAVNTDHLINEQQQKLVIEAIQAAGSPQLSLGDALKCIEVMTGAMLPANTNAVVPYEQCEIKNGIATINPKAISALQNIHLKGSDCKEGNLLLTKYTKINPAVIGVLATIGLDKVPVLKQCKVAVCSTGDELLDITQLPLPHQIRRSNSYSLTAALLKENIDVTIDHLHDEEALMLAQVSHLKDEHDVLIFSGAVSKGKYDFLPGVLQQLGMRTQFHYVAQRPGKPFLFGIFERGQVVFAFPGNPVSTLVCYYLYFKPWLACCLKQLEIAKWAQLGEDVEFKPDLSYHLLVTLQNDGGIFTAIPLNSSGSGDLVSISKANGFITLPAGKDVYKKGGVFKVCTFY
jgi:molybdopterin molybdotransferase